MKKNYGKMLDDTLQGLAGQTEKKKLLLHVCCAPCSSYVLEYLCEHFDITAYFYNPNISPRQEYEHRAKELHRLVAEMLPNKSIPIVVEDYDPLPFERMAKGMESLAEGGARCYACYALRLSAAANAAAAMGADYMTTTLSISPHKNAEWLNTLGAREAERVGVAYLYSDFKKHNGYKRSIELSKAYGLYRQDYCGCVYSRLQRENEKNANTVEKENNI